VQTVGLLGVYVLFKRYFLNTAADLNTYCWNYYPGNFAYIYLSKSRL